MTADSGDESGDESGEGEGEGEGEDCGCPTPVIYTSSFVVTPTPAATANVEGSTGSGPNYARGITYGAISTPLSTPTPTPTPVQYEGAGSKTTVSGLLVAGLGLLFTLF
ncbi:hypothetical protein SLS55_004867 [Diplodia seriata]|uniref:Uncharacterized protein n=1 Tax=Diplodia seriata TaxID=420778 RepID=A0ABR3CNC1_9PEZI